MRAHIQNYLSHRPKKLTKNNGNNNAHYHHFVINNFLWLELTLARSLSLSVCSHNNITMCFTEVGEGTLWSSLCRCWLEICCCCCCCWYRRRRRCCCWYVSYSESCLRFSFELFLFILLEPLLLLLAYFLRKQKNKPNQTNESSLLQQQQQQQQQYLKLMIKNKKKIRLTRLTYPTSDGWCWPQF